MYVCQCVSAITFVGNLAKSKRKQLSKTAALCICNDKLSRYYSYAVLAGITSDALTSASYYYILKCDKMCDIQWRECRFISEICARIN